MIRLQFAYRLILAAVSLLLSFQAPAFLAPAPGKMGVIHDGTRRLVDGRDRPDEYALLTAASGGGQSATRNNSGGGAGGSAVPASFSSLPVRVHGMGPAVLTAELREYRLRTTHIVLAQFQALFPKHWFW